MGRRRIVGLLAGVALCIAWATRVRARASEPASAPPEEVVTALRGIVAHPAWSVTVERLERGRLPSLMELWDGADALRSLFARARETHVLTATVRGLAAHVDTFVVRFEEEAAGESLLQEMRRVAAQGADDASVRVFDGAAGGEVPGFRVEPSEGEEGGLHVFRRGATVVALTASGVPGWNKRALGEWTARIDQIVRGVPVSALRPVAAPSFERHRILRVLVASADDRPVDRATVAVGTSRSFEARAGNAHFVLEDEGETVVGVWGAVSAEGAPLAPKALDVARGVRSINVRLEPAVSLAGHVLDAEGRPRAGVAVSARPVEFGGRLDGPMYAPISGDQPHGEALTATDGSFRIVGLAPISYRLDVRHGDRPLLAQEVRAAGGNSKVVVRTSALVDARIRVVTLDGSPLPGARVRAEAAAKTAATREGETDERGEVALRGLSPSTAYTLHVEAPFERDVADGGVAMWSPRDTVVRLERGWRVRGRVLESGRAPSFAFVWVDAGDGAPHQVPVLERGEFVTLRAFPWRPLRVAASRKWRQGHPPEELRWTTIEPGAGDVTIELSR